ncbi:DUF3116 family protein [Listeria kieliensis]
MEDVKLTTLEIEVIKRILDKDFYTKNLQNISSKGGLEESKYTLNDVLYTLYSLEERGIIKRNHGVTKRKTYFTARDLIL